MIRIYSLLAQLVLLPLISVFLGAELPPILGNLSLSSLLNFASLAFAALIVMCGDRRGVTNSDLVRFSALGAIGIYVTNFLACPEASVKWLLNTGGFLAIWHACVVGIANLDKGEWERLQTSIDVTISATLVTFIIFGLSIVVTEPWAVLDAVVTSDVNSNIALLTTRYSIEKQAFGNFLDIAVVWNVVNWKRSRRSRRYIFIAFCVILIPFWIGVRTSILSLLLLSVYYLLVTRRGFRIIAIVSTPIIVIGCLAARSAIWRLIVENYDRLPSLEFAVMNSMEQPMGVGNGGYHRVAERLNDMLSTKYGTMTSSTFWVAPESDLVYLIASFGILSIFFFGYFIILFVRSAKLLTNSRPNSGEAFVVLTCLAIVLSGISQDNAGMGLWWVYIGACIGVFAGRKQSLNARHEMHYIYHRVESRRRNIVPGLRPR